MPKTAPPSTAKPCLWDYAALFSALVFVLFLTINIDNRLIIINILDKSSLSGVGADAPLIYPLVAGVVSLLVSYLRRPKHPSLLWKISLTVLLASSFIWFFGLKHEVQNSFVRDVPIPPQTLPAN